MVYILTTPEHRYALWEYGALNAMKHSPHRSLIVAVTFLPHHLHLREVILYHQQSICFYDVLDHSIKSLASLQNRINDVVVYVAGLVAVRPAGFIAIVRDEDVSMLAALICYSFWRRQPIQ